LDAFLVTVLFYFFIKVLLESFFFDTRKDFFSNDFLAKRKDFFCI
jgi:hypothetical protein